MKKARRENYIRRLKEQQDNPDWEAAHGEADDILIDVLKALGYEDIVREWCKVNKWYA